MLSPQEAFKAGFLARCVEDRLTPEQIVKQAKVAADLFEKRGDVLDVLGRMGGKGVDAAKGVGEFALGTGLPLALAVPPVLGGFAGYGLARATDTDDTDVEELKDREVLDEYRRRTGQLLRQKAIRDYRNARKRTGRTFL